VRTAAVVMAAGRGTRMGSDLPKPLIRLGEKPLVHHLLDAIGTAGIQRRIVVIGHDATRVATALGPEIDTAVQPLLNGTASALQAAQSAVGAATQVLVTVGDSPLLTADSIRYLLTQHRKTRAACSFLTAQFERHFPYGRVLRGADGQVLGCVEERHASPAQRQIREYLSSHYVFNAEALWRTLPQIKPHPESQERYLTDIISLMVEAGERVEAVVIDDWRELVGLNTPDDLLWAQGVLGER
jgi:bifunctional N-acetylglucosamine-1-phosphate-uridyltransferase/glucosamine-1-phosphate-acetyltransferase GlmU-like protein